MCLCAFFGVHENSKMEHAFFSSFSPSDYPLKLKAVNLWIIFPRLIINLCRGFEHNPCASQIQNMYAHVSASFKMIKFACGRMKLY